MMRSFHLPAKLIEKPVAMPFDISEGPVDLEIGCGVGLHAIQRAQRFPERKLIAIEHTQEKFEKFARRLEHHEGLGNLWAVHDNAISWVTSHVPEETLDEIFLLYPNPNPKRKNQRWFNMPFMARLLLSLKPEGLFHLATNEKFYFDEAVEMATSLWSLKLVDRREIRPGESGRTHFERKYLLQGQTCFDVTFQK